MNLRQNQKGFTIVELLIVVVVIAILAAISIVAYTGITNRANRSAAMEAANSVKSVAAAFQGSQGKYPITKTEFQNGYATSGGNSADTIAKLPTDIVFNTTAPSGSTAPTSAKHVAVEFLGSSSAPTGFEIHYFDYIDNSYKSMTVGEGSRLSTRAFVPNS